MLNLDHFRHLVVRPTLEHLNPVIPYSLVAEELLIATMVHESTVAGTTSLKQIVGPALGVYQIEPATHADMWEHWAALKGPLGHKVRMLQASKPNAEWQLATNLMYATAIARCVYRRRPEPLPESERNIEELAAMWKVGYNTVQGKGEPAEFVRNYQRAVA